MADFSRRELLKVSASSGGALAAGYGIKQAGNLIPYVVPPEYGRPGVWTVFASTCRECPAGCGLHLRHRDGRAIKAEGNPQNPINTGALCPRGQSSVQGLYDPDRIPSVLHQGRVLGGADPWKEALAQVGEQLRGAGGKVALISDLQTGTLAEVMQRFVSSLGSDRLLYFEPFDYQPLRQAHQQVFGRAELPDYRLDRCEVVLSFGADFLESWVSPVQYARRFTVMHAERPGRHHYLGPKLSMTAANAERFIQLAPSALPWAGLAMLRTILDQGWGRPEAARLRPLFERLGDPFTRLPGVDQKLLRSTAEEFAKAKASVALGGPVGAQGPVATQLATVAALLNWACGRVGQTVDFSRPHALSRAASRERVLSLLEGLGPQDVLVIHGANLAYALPESIVHLRRAGSVIYLGTMPDETAALAGWVLPIDSPLEAWGDYEPVRGVHGLIQPTTARLYDSYLAGDVLIALAQQSGAPFQGDFQALLRDRWERLAGPRPAEPGGPDPFVDALRAGGVWLEVPPVEVGLQDSALGQTFSEPPPPMPADTAELWAWAPIQLFDGRVANRGWLQETPDPISSIVWGSWIELHPLKAHELGISEGDLLTLEGEGGARVMAAARVTLELNVGTVALGFGQGHLALGRHAANRGANAFSLLGTPAPQELFGRVTLKKAEGHTPLLFTSATTDQHERELLQWVPLAELRRLQPGEGTKLHLPLPEGYEPTRDLYLPHPHNRHRWAMTVDLQRCIGCQACAVACYAENNIPVVGPEEMAHGRELAWLKVAAYRHPEEPGRLGFLPMLCQHCDAAPCEPVCPVFAAYHNEEGLNGQVYSRCIGTRYCNNNCPYKVRRFNWFSPVWPSPLHWQLNPEVSARGRGVMEKCTFCIQRIREVQHRAKREGRPLSDGEVVPACAQTCPTRAIWFGDLLNPDSAVSYDARRDPRRYHVLGELNVKPAVTYLRRIHHEP